MLPCALLEVGDIEVAAGGAGEHTSVGRAAAELLEVGAQHGRLGGLEMGASAAQVAVGSLRLGASSFDAVAGIGPRAAGRSQRAAN